MAICGRDVGRLPRHVDYRDSRFPRLVYARGDADFVSHPLT